MKSHENRAVVEFASAWLCWLGLAIFAFGQPTPNAAAGLGFIAALLGGMGALIAAYYGWRRVALLLDIAGWIGGIVAVILLTTQFFSS